MKKKALALAVAGAFFAPASYAAQDNAGMHYTSAAEGFYASIRMVFTTERNTDHTGTNGDANSNSSGFVDGFSRFGVRGSNDLGNGLKGFYQFEANAPTDNSGGVTARLGHVGLEGAFGRVWVGSGWATSQGMTYGVTDVANFSSGNIYEDIGPGRISRSIQYTTPDVSGFQGALAAVMDSRVDGMGMVQDGNPANVTDDNNVDWWSVAARYNVQGFTGAFSYNVSPDSMAGTAANTREDGETWAARLSYAQDNWHVHGWYGKDNNGDSGTANAEDGKFVSLSSGVAVGKVNMYGVWEKSDEGVTEDAYTVIGVQYNLGSRSRVWMEYAGRDLDSSTTEEDSVNIGLRHDF